MRTLETTSVDTGCLLLVNLFVVAVLLPQFCRKTVLHLAVQVVGPYVSPGSIGQKGLQIAWPVRSIYLVVLDIPELERVEIPLFCYRPVLNFLMKI